MQVFAQAVISQGGELLNQNGDIIEHWKDYFEGLLLLNPTTMSYVEDAGCEESEASPSSS